MKKRTLIYSDDYDTSFDNRIYYYAKELENKPLARKFVKAVEKTVHKIAAAPESYGQFFDEGNYKFLDEFNIRKAQVEGFQELIFFQYDEETATLRLIEHGARELGWHLAKVV